MSTPCQIIDISLVGCMVESYRFSSRMERQSVLLRPLGVSASDWIEGIVVSVRKPLFRKCQIRIRFLASFPYNSFKTLVFGPDRSGELAGPEPLEHEKDHFWR